VVNIRILLIGVILTICFSSCNNNKEIIVRPIQLPQEDWLCFVDKVDKTCEELYSIENLVINSIEDIDSINQFVMKHYSKEKAKKYKSYNISFFKHDAEEYRKLSEIGSTLLYKRFLHMEWMLSYYWKEGEFEGVRFKQKNKSFDHEYYQPLGLDL